MRYVCFRAGSRSLPANKRDHVYISSFITNTTFYINHENKTSIYMDALTFEPLCNIMMSMETRQCIGYVTRDLQIAASKRNGVKP